MRGTVYLLNFRTMLQQAIGRDQVGTASTRGIGLRPKADLGAVYRARCVIKPERRSI